MDQELGRMIDAKAMWKVGSAPNFGECLKRLANYLLEFQSPSNVEIGITPKPPLLYFRLHNANTNHRLGGRSSM
jgi:hypothetical protein